METMQLIIASAMPWSAPHANEGKLVALSQGEFSAGGYYRTFEKGDFVFVRTSDPNEKVVRPAIYAVSKVGEFSRETGFEIFWELRLIGGYGAPKINLYYQHPYGENPGAYVEEWFPDLGHGPNMPKLNYYVEKVVRNGKTVWDVEDQLESL